MKVQKTSEVSALSYFAHYTKAADKKSIYKRALEAAKEEQLLMIGQSKQSISNCATA